LERYGSRSVPELSENDQGVRPRRTKRRRPVGWVTVREVEASQSPNAYPRLTRRTIRVRCEGLVGRPNSPVLEVRQTGFRTWVRVSEPVLSGLDEASVGTGDV
jgi:hypothetical protein